MTLKLRLNPKDVGISVIYSSLSMGTILVSLKIVRFVLVLRFYDDDDDDSNDDDDNDGQKHRRLYTILGSCYMHFPRRYCTVNIKGDFVWIKYTR